MPNYPGSPNANLSGNVNPAALNNNYLGTQINGRDSHLYDWRVDYDLSHKDRLSSVGAMGQFVYLNNFGSPYLPLPYALGRLCHHRPQAIQHRGSAHVHDHLTNQFKIGYTRFYMPITNATDGVHAIRGWNIRHDQSTGRSSGQRVSRGLVCEPSERPAHR